MAYYGQTLDVDYDPTKERIYLYFVEYFDNPTMTKIKDVDDYSMYITKIHALLGVEFRYIIVFIYKDNSPIGTTEQLVNLQWISLQTRSLSEDHKLPYHSYIPRRLASLNKQIRKIEPSNQYVYNVDTYPLTITLLPKDKSQSLEYSSTGTIITALETYSTIVSFKN